VNVQADLGSNKTNFASFAGVRGVYTNGSRPISPFLPHAKLRFVHLFFMVYFIWK